MFCTHQPCFDNIEKYSPLKMSSSAAYPFSRARTNSRLANNYYEDLASEESGLAEDIERSLSGNIDDESPFIAPSYRSRARSSLAAREEMLAEEEENLANELSMREEMLAEEEELAGFSPAMRPSRRSASLQSKARSLREEAAAERRLSNLYENRSRMSGSMKNRTVLPVEVSDESGEESIGQRSLKNERRSALTQARSLANERRSALTQARSLANERRSAQTQRRSLENERRSLENERRSLENERRSLRNLEKTIMDEEQDVKEKERSIMEEEQELESKRRSLLREERSLLSKKRSLREEKRSIMSKKQSLGMQEYDYQEEDMDEIEPFGEVSAEEYGEVSGEEYEDSGEEYAEMSGGYDEEERQFMSSPRRNQSFMAPALYEPSEEVLTSANVKTKSLRDDGTVVKQSIKCEKEDDMVRCVKTTKTKRKDEIDVDVSSESMSPRLVRSSRR